MSGFALPLFALLAFSFASVTVADSWPTRPLHIIVPAPAGGGSEILSRRIAHKLEPALGRPVVVEAKPGASGTLGTALAAKAAPDGYTLLFGHVGTFGMGPHMMKSLPYDPLKDFLPVPQLAVSPMLILVNAAFPARDLKELVALARRTTYVHASRNSAAKSSRALLRSSPSWCAASTPAGKR